MLSANQITLRAPEPEDVDTLYIWENDRDAAEGWPGAAPVSRLQVWNYVHNYDADPLRAGELRLVITDSATGNRLGQIDLLEIDRVNSRAGVAVYVAPEHRRRRIGTAALKLTVNYAMHTLGLHQLWAEVAVDNAPSMALFATAGFKPCGRLRSWIRRGHAAWTDVILLQRLNVKV